MLLLMPDHCSAVHGCRTIEDLLRLGKAEPFFLVWLYLLNSRSKSLEVLRSRSLIPIANMNLLEGWALS